MTQFVTDLISIIDSTNKIEELGENFLWKLATQFDCCQGIFYHRKNNSLHFIEGFAYHSSTNENLKLELGEGITGQVAKDGKYVILSSVPEGYLTVVSGLGQSSPSHLLIFPFTDDGVTYAVIELASFAAFTPQTIDLLTQLNTHLVQKLKSF